MKFYNWSFAAEVIQGGPKNKPLSEKSYCIKACQCD